MPANRSSAVKSDRRKCDHLRKAARILFRKYRPKLLLAFAVVFGVVVGLVIWRIEYWSQVWNSTSQFVVGQLLGTTWLSLLAGLLVSGLAYMMGRLFTPSKHRIGKDLKTAMLSIGLGAVAIWTFVWCCYLLLIAPPQLYRTRSEDYAIATNNLAKIQNRTDDATYKSLLGQVADAKRETEREKSGRLKAEDQAFKWLMASSNSFTVIPALNEGIAMYKADFPTNTLAARLAAEKKIKALEQRKAIEEQKERFIPFYAFLRYIAMDCQKSLDAMVNRCGSKAELIQLPTIDWLATGYNQTNVTSTKCDVRFTYEFKANAYPSFEISAKGQKATPARVVFRYGLGGKERTIESILMIDGAGPIQRISPIEDQTNCVANVQEIIGLFVESQVENFK